jgi:hypothetical protein
MKNFYVIMAILFLLIGGMSFDALIIAPKYEFQVKALNSLTQRFLQDINDISYKNNRNNSLICQRFSFHGY